MKVFTALEQLTQYIRHGERPTITIGNFDGIHKGHLELIKKARDISKRHGEPWGVVTFSPHPKDYFESNPTPKLFTYKHKTKCLETLGADFICSQTFDKDFSKWSPEKFFSAICPNTNTTRAIIVGENFRFGENRSGNIETLEGFCNSHKTLFQAMPTLKTSDNQTVCSTLIRSAVSRGDIQIANTLLGRRYFVEGKTKKGKRLGRTIQIPTLNLTEIEQLIPAPGVYSGWIQTSDFHFVPSVINIGTNPTVDQGSSTLKIEGHAIETRIREDYYEESAIFLFETRIRDEKAFSSLDRLKNQIKEDIAQAKQHLAKTKKPEELFPSILV